MHPSDIAIVLLGLMTVCVAFVTFRQAQRANRAQSEHAAKVVDAEAYERAQALYESAIRTAVDESRRLRSEVAVLHDEVGRLRTEVDRLQATNAALLREVADLKRAAR
jgi:predicted  nucleic acid-binding Zn-ribbon protein